MSKSNMKVVVVGGGPVGLVAAHALSRLGVDFVVLESRSKVVLDEGSNLVLMPMAMRSLYQLGLEEAIVDATTALGVFERFDHDGNDIGAMYFSELMEKLVGARSRVISRRDLIKILYESLPAEAQAKVLVDKRASTVTTDSDTGLVTVTCRDGSSHAGTLIIGADGAHSVVREQMRQLGLAGASSPDGTEGINDEKPYLTTYRCLWFRYPSALYPDLPAGIARETHGYGCTTQMFPGEGTGVAGLYETLPEPTRERIRYTEEDQEAVVERWGHLPLVKGGGLTLREMYDSRIESGLVSLEEGVLDHWSWDGRVVLLGDAAHKFTPSTGAGCNHGIIDVVVLANELARTLAENSNPSKGDVALALDRYQGERYKAVVAGCKQSGGATAMATWASPVFKFVDTWVVPWKMFQGRMLRKGAERIALTPAFEFIAGEETMIGEIPWARPIPTVVA